MTSEPARAIARVVGLAALLTIAGASARCTYEIAGTEVRVVFLHHGDPRMPSDDGSIVVLTDVHVRFDRVELEPCESHARGDVAWISVARAHGGHEEAVIPTAFVETLGSGAVVGGEASPPAGAYCAAIVRIAPDAATARSISLSGMRTQSSETSPFEVEGSGTWERRIAFGEPLVIDDEHPAASIELTTWPHRWLHGVDLTRGIALDEAIARAILDTMTLEAQGG